MCVHIHRCMYSACAAAPDVRAGIYKTVLGLSVPVPVEKNTLASQSKSSVIKSLPRSDHSD
jgi:hypothetical protein